MNFINFITDNFFIVAIVAIGLFNLLSRSKGKSEEQQNEERKQQQTQTRKASPSSPREQGSQPLGRFEGAPQRLEERIERMGRKVEEKIEGYAESFNTHTSSTTKTIDEQRQEQLDRLKKDMNTRHAIPERQRTKDMAEVSSPVDSLPVTSKIKETEVSGLKLDDKLTARGLIDSVIMAEVLGPPRALNPYQNIAAKRKRR